MTQPPRNAEFPTMNRRIGLTCAVIGALSFWTCAGDAVASGAEPPTSGSTALIGARDSYADVVDRVAPAVVTIHSAQRVRAPQQFPFPADPFFRQFFGIPNRVAPQVPPATTQESLGSGVVVSAEGYILTNQHVVDGAEHISVELNDRRTFDAKLIGADAASDLALLKIEARNLPMLSLGDSDKVRVGDVCLAIGNPLGIGETVTSGIISARGRATGLSDGSFEDFLQTDAPINQGNSGGALINTRGELIGINSQIISMSGGGSIGIGFAIPSNMANNVMQQLEHGGRVRRGKLGADTQTITSQVARSLGGADIHGVLVNSVEPGGPAESAGIRPGDVISAVNGHRVDDPNALRNVIANFLPGTQVNITVLAGGKERQIETRLAELDHTPSSAGAPAGSEGRLGVSVGPLTTNLATRLGLPRGTRGLTVLSVDPKGPAAQAGLQPSDVILEINHQPVGTAAELSAALRGSASPVLLLINRQGLMIFLALGLA